MKKQFKLILINSIFAVSLISCGGSGETTTTANTSNDSSSTTNTTVTAPTTTFSNNIKGNPVVVSGKVSGAPADMRVFLDKKTADGHEIAASVKLNADGSFELKSGVEQPSIFRLRIDINPVFLILNGGENISVNAALTGDKLTECSIEGSEDSKALLELSRKNEKEIAAYLNNAPAEKALSNYLLVEKLNITDHIKLYAKVRDQLAAQSPASVYAAPFGVKVMQEESRINTPQPAKIAIGEYAPDIRLKDPEGKTYSLSQLKGKVVLLDFWASWCGPCRRENPNVVRVYKQYKSKGFEVFSVSLDGLNDQAMTRLGSPEQINAAMENERKKWKDAIAKDGLEWEYHVSELRSWSTRAAAVYQVNSIPNTFLIDRQGKIRYRNLRGAELETRLKEIL